MTSHRPPRKPNAQHGELADRTYRQLRELIVRGRLPPGARAMETELAKRFGVSRTPVRESLARLAQEGVALTLIVHPNVIDQRIQWRRLPSRISSAALKSP